MANFHLASVAFGRVFLLAGAVLVDVLLGGHTTLAAAPLLKKKKAKANGKQAGNEPYGMGRKCYKNKDSKEACKQSAGVAWPSWAPVNSYTICQARHYVE